MERIVRDTRVMVVMQARGDESATPHANAIAIGICLWSLSLSLVWSARPPDALWNEGSDSDLKASESALDNIDEDDDDADSDISYKEATSGQAYEAITGHALPTIPVSTTFGVRVAGARPFLPPLLPPLFPSLFPPLPFLQQTAPVMSSGALGQVVSGGLGNFNQLTINGQPVVNQVVAVPNLGTSTALQPQIQANSPAGCCATALLQLRNLQNQRQVPQIQQLQVQPANQAINSNSAQLLQNQLQLQQQLQQLQQQQLNQQISSIGLQQAPLQFVAQASGGNQGLLPNGALLVQSPSLGPIALVAPRPQPQVVVRRAPRGGRRRARRLRQGFFG